MRRVLPRVVGSSRSRTAAFRFVSQLGIRYRESPAIVDARPRVRGGPRAGERLPDARVTIDGEARWLQEAVAGPCMALLLCGDPAPWDAVPVGRLRARFPETLTIHHLTRSQQPGVLVDESGDALATLGVTDTAHYLVRPDGYIAFRSAGHDLQTVGEYLDRWFG
jgi:hypothetical protein